jgi:hypothetical protein
MEEGVRTGTSKVAVYPLALRSYSVYHVSTMRVNLQKVNHRPRRRSGSRCIEVVIDIGEETRCDDSRACLGRFRTTAIPPASVPG